VLGVEAIGFELFWRAHGFPLFWPRGGRNVGQECPTYRGGASPTLRGGGFPPLDAQHADGTPRSAGQD
jgi:hypothetical protein